MEAIAVPCFCLTICYFVRKRSALEQDESISKVSEVRFALP